MISTKITLLSAMLAACTLTVTASFADDAFKGQPGSSRAVILTDAQLDEIRAGKVDFMEHLVINNGNAFVDKVNNQHIECVNCLGFGDVGKTVVVVIVQNPAQTITHIVHPF